MCISQFLNNCHIYIQTSLFFPLYNKKLVSPFKLIPCRILSNPKSLRKSCIAHLPQFPAHPVTSSVLQYISSFPGTEYPVGGAM